MGGAQGWQGGRIAQGAADAGQRLQMFGAGRFRRQQQHQRIDKFAVHSAPVDRLRQPGNNRHTRRQARQPCVRDRRAAAKAGRAQRFARAQPFVDQQGGMAQHIGRVPGQRQQRCVLGKGRQDRNNPVRRQQPGKARHQ